MESELPPARVLITGAAGHIGYVLAFRVANGDLFGKRKVILHLLEITPALKALEAVVMELNDCTFPNLLNVIGTDQIDEAFRDIDIAFLVGSFPKKPALSQQDYLTCNATIFREHGVALSKYSKKSVRVLVVGNPANTNALITIKNAEGIPPSNISAMTRLDHNRAVSAVSQFLQVHSSNVYNVVVWGNRSATQFADVSNVEFISDDGNHKFSESISENFDANEFSTNLPSRGVKLTKMRSGSIAASAATAAIFHMKDWLFGTREKDFVSMAVQVPESQPYGITKGLVFSLPCRVDSNGIYHIVDDLKLDEFVLKRIKDNEQELLDEAQMVAEFLQKQ